MDTLSLKDLSKITCGAFYYSGRPDPVKELDEETFEELIVLWKSFPVTGEQPPLPQTGYRGCWIRRGYEQWLAYNGAITYSEKGAVKETRTDEGMIIEERIKKMLEIE
jgi:hypothetical protein